MINIILNKNENRAIALDKNVKIGECVYEENNNIINFFTIILNSNFNYKFFL